MQVLFILTLALIASHVTVGHPHGAPTTACNTMYPLHKHNPQTSACPFETHPYETEIFSNSSVKIALNNLSLLSASADSSGSSSETTSIDSFKGYMIMAFEVPSENTVALGTFQVNSADSHTINCHGMQKNAATHSSKSHKNIVQLTWIPPENFEGDVIFKTTFVASKKLFWINQVSATVRVKSASIVSDSEINDKSFLIIQNGVTEGKLLEMTSLESNQYISLWTICSLFIVGFTCAVLTKLIMTNRAKKYSSLATI